MKRLRTLAVVLALALALAAFALNFLMSTAGATPAEPAAARLVAAARAQIGVTLRYDPAYSRISFPGGDVPRDRGVCTDVVIRAYRDAFGLDLQRRVHDDMVRNFSVYPRRWGARATDASIDHRRVPNLQVFFRRNGSALPISADAADYAPGDLVTQMLPGELPHIAIVADRRSADGARPLVVHNIGAGAQQEDTLFAYRITGHYRFDPRR